MEGKYRNLAAMNDSLIAVPLLERFVRYAAVTSQSSMETANKGVFPSTECQKDMARLLFTELKELGRANARVTGSRITDTPLTDVRLTDNFYVLARIPATKGFEGKPAFGLSSHFDTASDAPGDNVKPQIHRNYDGKPIVLEGGFSIDPSTDPALASCVGDTIITSDGTTLLGADDKAGIAGIITLAEILLSNTDIPHGPIEIMFSPDEETGHGMDWVPLKEINAKAFYTVDGGELGEIEAECFNAWKAEVIFSGVSAHLGTARGKMVNAVTMAANFITHLPAQESPETTDGYYGYFCPLEIHGGSEEATVTLFLRDFDEDGIKRRLERVDAIAKGIEAQFPEGSVTVKKTCQYLNMKKKLDEQPRIMELLKEATARAGVTAAIRPIRGGTDGSRLTEMGIPTPNIFTGGHNYHSRTVWASLNQMTKMVRTLIELAKLWGES